MVAAVGRTQGRARNDVQKTIDQDMLDWLSGGLGRADGRLALFDRFGEPVDPKMVRRCVQAGLAEPWFANPMRPSWMVCRLSDQGRAVATKR